MATVAAAAGASATKPILFLALSKAVSFGDGDAELLDCFLERFFVLEELRFDFRLLLLRLRFLVRSLLIDRLLFLRLVLRDLFFERSLLLRSLRLRLELRSAFRDAL